MACSPSMTTISHAHRRSNGRVQCRWRSTVIGTKCRSLADDLPPEGGSHLSTRALGPRTSDLGPATWAGSPTMRRDKRDWPLGTHLAQVRARVAVHVGASPQAEKIEDR